MEMPENNNSYFQHYKVMYLHFTKCWALSDITMNQDNYLKSSYIKLYYFMSIHWIEGITQNICIITHVNLVQANITNAIDWTFVPLTPRHLGWNLITHVMVFGSGGAFGWLSHDGGALINGIGTLIKDLIELPCIFSHGHIKELLFFQV